MSTDDPSAGSGPSGPGGQHDEEGVGQPTGAGPDQPKLRHTPGDLKWLFRHLDEQRKRKELEQKYPAQVVAVRIVGSSLFLSVFAVLLTEDFAQIRTGFQILLVALALGVSVLLLVSGVLTKHVRSKFLEVAAVEGGPSIFSLGGLTLAIWIWATLGFAGLSTLLYLHGVATTAPDHTVGVKDPVADVAVNFYLWKSLDAIPVLEIPQTAGWEPAFRFTDHVSPVLLLLYKIVVITPVIETGRLIWQNRQKQRNRASM